MKRALPILLASLSLLAACGKNDVVVDIRGGDDHWIRLDAEALRHQANRLVKSGSYDFSEVKKGSYQVSVVSGTFVESHRIDVDSPPLSGVTRYSVGFDIPKGAGNGFERRGTIVYASTPTRVRNWDLFTVDVGTGEISQLTDTHDFEQHPRWSPDGKRILFTMGDVMTNFDIWVMNADGSARTRLTEHPERDTHPAWSPDGSRIAFVSQRDGDVSIWLMDADGADLHKLVQGRTPAWSPDGQRIAFTSSAFAGNDEIYVIHTDGTHMRRLTDDKRIDWEPAWSPDGSRLAFASERFGGQELMVAGGDFTQQVRVTIAEHTFEVGPEWSPDGRGLAYSGKMTIGDDGELVADGKGRPLGTYDIYVLPVAGFDWDDTTERPVVPVNLTHSDDRDEGSPSWRSF